jgi:hypothetical protein
MTESEQALLIDKVRYTVRGFMAAKAARPKWIGDAVANLLQKKLEEGKVFGFTLMSEVLWHESTVYYRIDEDDFAAMFGNDHP